jgi:hypothetical protein
MVRFRFMVIDEDGQRLGRFESDDPNWRAGDTFVLDEQMLRIVEILPEVSTMVAYNAVWVAAPVTDEDKHATDPASPASDEIGRVPIY